MSVESFVPAAPDHIGWWLLKLENDMNEYLVHNNWCIPLKEKRLRPGDKVSFEVLEKPHYRDDPHIFLKKLERIVKVAYMEGHVTVE